MNHLDNNFVFSAISRFISRSVSAKETAMLLGISERYVRKLANRIRSEGPSCLSHGNKGIKPPLKTDPATESRITDLYKDKYSCFNFSHFLKFLNNAENIKISYGALFRILSDAGFKSPRAQHKKKKNNSHPSRPRRTSFGELLQIDASIHPWFRGYGTKYALHGAIDDATGTVMGLWFDHQETLDGYYNMLRMTLMEYGIPKLLYSDRRTVFKSGRKALDDEGEGTATQFSRCCAQFGIDITSTSVPQAKGRIERLWGTLQSRLYAELALNNITNIKDANEFLAGFTKDFNKEFALDKNNVPNAFREAPDKNEIDYYLSVGYKRKVDSGCTFSLKNSKYQLCDNKGNTIRIPKGDTINVYVTFDKKVVAVWQNRYYETKLAEMTEIDLNKENAATKEQWKPGANHPWRKRITAQM